MPLPPVSLGMGVAQAPHRLPQVLPPGLQLGHSAHQPLQEISRLAEARPHAADGIHCRCAGYGGALRGATRRVSAVGMVAARTARPLLPADSHRLLTREPQPENRLPQHSLSLHTANGLRLRIHRVVVETLRKRKVGILGV